MSTDNKIDKARGARILRVRKDVLGLRSQEAFAQRLGQHGLAVTRGAVGNWETGKDVGLDSLTAICEMSGVNLDWLAYGKGSMKLMVSSYDPDDTDSPDEKSVNGYSRDHWRPEVEGALPEIDARLGAGEGVVGDTIALATGSSSISAHRVVSEWLFPLSYLRNEMKATPNQTVVMEVIGDSMQPTFMPGDKVLVDLSQNEFMADTVYAISDGYAEPQIKRLQRIPFSNPTLVKIISDNHNLETFEVELSRLTVIGRICGHIARR